MSATLIQRFVYEGDYENDGGAIDGGYFRALLGLYDSDLIDAAFIKTVFSLTTPQGNQLDEILATRPGSILGVLTQSRWVEKVAGIILAGTQHLTGFETAADVENQLGI